MQAPLCRVCGRREFGHRCTGKPAAEPAAPSPGPRVPHTPSPRQRPSGSPRSTTVNGYQVAGPEPAQPFDRAAYMRAYMKDYRRGLRRTAKPAPAG